tara:strand:+ start:541 stop:1191 length:651 start_codon:yes stop_codon:yes gene_type:complete
MFIYDDLELYENKNFRSSYYVLKLWDDYIQQEFIANLGIRKSMMISIYLDDETLFFTMTSDYKAIFTKNITIKIPHMISALEELSTSINMTITSSENYDTQFNICAYFFDLNNKKDEGTIEIDLYSFCNIQNYINFKVDILTKLAKEMQYAIQRNYLDKDVNTDFCCHYDSEFEAVKTYSMILDKTFEESIKDLVDKNIILADDTYVLNQINNLVS